MDPFFGPAFFIGKMAEIDNVQQIAQRIAGEHGYSLVLASFVREQPGWVLRVLVEKIGSDPMTGSGVDHAVCARISHQLGDLIEAENLIDKAFVLEVSSPGIERPLVTPADYERFKGREARFKLRDAVDNRRKVQGVILDANAERVRIESGKSKTVVELPFAIIQKANLVFNPPR